MSEFTISADQKSPRLTDIDGLDSDTLFDVSSVWVVADLVSDDLRLAEGIDECRASCPRGT